MAFFALSIFSEAASSFMTVRVHASCSSFSSPSLLEYLAAPATGKFNGGSEGFLVLDRSVIKVRTRFLPNSDWFSCTMA